ncbi:hypothetical protein KFL_001980140 [Klebsormidium nitens]|uniref:Uncharacterized protein n=1 Tax=Klebsormidium nitens TaxID=105231 RepID=A0A1Y1I3U5_KLENI|nr:hypothetical protein KFL_001980140 [Klebsormidium nitens]|eukprot:GAQ84632.1 hypothetical protein KFL_001980140 [Klebsormidium nitens]
MMSASSNATAVHGLGRRSGIDWRFQAKLAAVCFVVGASMELFMIKTGFYNKVTAIEAERRASSPEQVPSVVTALQAAEKQREHIQRK